MRLGFLLIPLALGCFALSPTARAVTSAPDGCVPDQYIITPGTDQIVPGTIDIGNHTDDGDTFISLPFPFRLYGHTYNSVNVSSNGRLDFVCVNEPLGYATACLPAPANQCRYDQTIFAMWKDMRTDFGLSGCSGFPGGNCGIFTSVTGSAPDRIFNIEWRTVLFICDDVPQNFEVRLYENPALNQQFDVIFGELNRCCFPPPLGCIDDIYPWVSGVQGLNSVFTQDFCIDPGGIPPRNVSGTYTIQSCIEVDIKPGTFPNSINPRSKGVIPVAILTTDTFDATTVDETTVRFGPNGTEAAPVQSALEDVDGDGDTDMILHFKTQNTGIVCGDTSASLTGETFGGQAIEGSDSIKTVGCK